MELQERKEREREKVEECGKGVRERSPAEGGRPLSALEKGKGRGVREKGRKEEGDK